MNQREKKLIIVLRLLAAFLSLALLASGTYAWLSVNRYLSSKGMQMKVQDQGKMHFVNEVKGERTELDGTKTSNTYELQEDNSIKLVASMVDGVSVAVDSKEDLSFLFTNMLPGEYVDITVGFYLSNSYNNLGYEIALADFDIEGDQRHFDLMSALEQTAYRHSLLGVIKWRPIEKITRTVDNDGNEIESKEALEEDFNMLGTYKIGEDDEIPERITLLKGVWKTEYTSISYTFRLQVDFSQYYQLIGKSSDTDINNLLSEKQLSIGSIVLLGD